MVGSPRSIVVISILVAAACDAQVDSDYPGPVLATIEGSLRTQRMQSLADPEVAVVWAKLSRMNGLVGADRVAAEGLFPQFRLSIHTPPPDDELDELDGERYGVALVAVGTVGTDYTKQTNWFGVDFERVVVYLPQDTLAGKTLEAFLHGPQSRGFHVYSVHRLTEEERAQRLACVNQIPHPGRMLSMFDIYSRCGGAGRDELNALAADLETRFDIEIVEGDDIVDLINRSPRW
jgi:hypothetical protein